MNGGSCAAGPSTKALAAYFLGLGAIGFGGPAALADRIQRDLVERRGWMTPREYELGLTIAAACPGPLAYQLAIYCGYVRHGVPGAFVVALTFALVPFVVVAGIAATYEHWSTSAVARGLFHGAGPVVVALIARACWSLGRKTLHRAPLAWAVCAAGAIVTWATGREPLWLFVLAGGACALLLRPSRPSDRAAIEPPPREDSSGSRLLPAMFPLAAVAGTSTSWSLFGFFFKTGCLVFGSGLVIVPFLRGTVVESYRWLTVQEFLDAVTIGLVTPGPVVITATFVGYVVGRLPGAIAATVGMFLPAVLFTLAAAPWFGRHRNSPGLTGFVRGITAAVVGVLAGTVPLIAASAVTDPAAAAILAAALAAMVLTRLPDAVVVALGAAAGVALAV
jgi:chromate transporter